MEVVVVGGNYLPKGFRKEKNEKIWGIFMQQSYRPDFWGNFNKEKHTLEALLS